MGGGLGGCELGNTFIILAIPFFLSFFFCFLFFCGVVDCINSSVDHVEVDKDSI